MRDTHDYCRHSAAPARGEGLRRLAKLTWRATRLSALASGRPLAWQGGGRAARWQRRTRAWHRAFVQGE